MTAREYFDEHVVIAIEVEFVEGGRQWSYYDGIYKAEEAIELIQEYGDYLSDYDYASKNNQKDKFCKRILELADLNFWKNPDWVHRNKLESYDDVIYFILDNGLYKAS